MSNRNRYYRGNDEEKAEVAALVRPQSRSSYDDIHFARNQESFETEDLPRASSRHSRRGVDPVPSSRGTSMDPGQVHGRYQDEEDSPPRSRFLDASKERQQHKTQMERAASRRMMNTRRVVFGTFGIILCASVLTCLSTFGCWFMNVRINFFVRDALGIPGFPSSTDELGLGLWSKESIKKPGSCAIWWKDEGDAVFDSYWKVGRAFSMMASILSIIASIVSLVVLTDGVRCLGIRSAAIYLAFLSICQGLAFLAYKSNLCRVKAECLVQRGTRYGIAAAALYFFLSIFYLWLDHKSRIWWENVDMDNFRRDLAETQASRDNRSGRG